MPVKLKLDLKRTATKLSKIRGMFLVKATKEFLSYQWGTFTVSVAQTGDVRIGKVTTWVVTEPTQESDYKKMGDVVKSHFRPVAQDKTDNPDYVYRFVKQYE